MRAFVLRESFFSSVLIQSCFLSELRGFLCALRGLRFLLVKLGHHRFFPSLDFRHVTNDFWVDRNCCPFPQNVCGGHFIRVAA